MLPTYTVEVMPAYTVEVIYHCQELDRIENITSAKEAGPSEMFQ